VLSSWTGSSNEAIRTLGWAGLIQLGAPGTLKTAMDRLLPTADKNSSLWAAALAVREYLRSDDPRDLDVLRNLCAKAPHDLQLAAAYALAAVHSKPTLPYLAGLLDSDDPEVTALGIGGLGMFANNVAILSASSYASRGMLLQAGPAPYRTQDTMSHFAMTLDGIRGQEASFITFWRQWWADHS